MLYTFNCKNCGRRATKEIRPSILRPEYCCQKCFRSYFKSGVPRKDYIAKQTS